MLASIALLIFPKVRENEKWLGLACAMVFIGTWIDKGMGIINGGFVPNMFEQVHEYIPTIPELLITMGVYTTGAIMLTVFYKVAIEVKAEVES